MKEKTKEIRLTKSDFENIRQSAAICSCCGIPFVKEEEEFKVCRDCVKEAMEEGSYE